MVKKQTAMKKLIIISMILLLSSLPLYAEDDPTFCNNPQAWNHINAMVEKDPNDIPLQILHALKIGLCVKIEQNSIVRQKQLICLMIWLILWRLKGKRNGKGEKSCELILERLYEDTLSCVLGFSG